MYANSITVSGGTLNGTGGKSYDKSYGVYANSITVNGGTLNCTGGKTDNAGTSYGVWASNITVYGGALTGMGGVLLGTDGESYGVRADVNITVSGTGVLNGTGGTAQYERDFSCGVRADVNITVSGTGVLNGTGGTAQHERDFSYGVRADSITVSGTGVLNGTGGTASGTDGESTGVHTRKGITVEGGSLTGTGGAVSGNKGLSGGVFTARSITVRGGVLTGTGGESLGSGGESYGVCAYNSNITVSGGTLNGISGKATGSNGSSCGVYSNDSITVEGGSLTAKSDDADDVSYGVRAKNGFTVSGGTTKVTGITSAVNKFSSKATGMKITGSTSYNAAESSLTAAVWDDTDNYNVSGSVAKALKLVKPAATVSDVTVAGQAGAAITDTDITLMLTDEKFNAAAAGTDVSSWFTNLPSGLSATLVSALAQDVTSAVITISGTPTAASTAAMDITIPAAALADGNVITVTENANAKWDIAAAYTPSESSGPLINEPDTDIPQTGDNGGTIIGFAMIALFIAAAVAAGVKRRRT